MTRTRAPAGPAPIRAVLDRLHERYPDPRYELEWQTPVQMLIATILAAQCTDERVNKVTATLFPKYPHAAAFARADRDELEQAILSTGFFRQKAKTIQEVCRLLVERHGGEVPQTMAELTALPGVARKTASVVMASCFGTADGVIVDTHVERVSQRMGLSAETKGERIERDLMALVPRDEWRAFGLAMVLFGRYTCTARDPRCPECPMNDICPRIGVAGPGEGRAPAKPARAAPGAGPGKGKTTGRDKDKGTTGRAPARGGKKAKP